jgi:hypothetical protein
MRRIRVSIAALLTGIALFGVTLTALIYPSPLAGNAFFTLTVGTLMTGLLGAVYSRGRKRAFWIGFSTFGWAYFLANYGPEPISNVASNLVTEGILEILYPYTIPHAESGDASVVPPALLPQPVPPMLPGDPPSSWETWTTSDRTTGSYYSSPRMFNRIGHSLFCLLFASIGGILARRFHENRERAEERAVPTPPT